MSDATRGRQHEEPPRTLEGANRDADQRSSRPPTSEPIRLPTQELKMPDVSQPARAGSGQGWKKTPKTDTVEARGDGGGRTLGIILAVVILVGIVGAAGYFGRNYISFTSRDDNVGDEARQLIRERRFTEALNRLDARGVPDDLKAELRASARAAWLEQARKLYTDDHDYRRRCRSRRVDASLPR